MQNDYKFSQKDVDQAFKFWIKDWEFHGNDGTQPSDTEYEYMALVREAENMHIVNKKWPTLGEVLDRPHLTSDLASRIAANHD
jgi:hypothetical protein